MNLFDGLYSYEAVMLVLGVLLFLALLVAFVFFVIHGKTYSKLLPFFAIPIVMVGFPAIQSFQFGESILKVEKYTKAVEENPTDVDLRNSLREEVADVSGRPSNDPQVSITKARAEFVLGDHAAAEMNLRKALQQAPQLPEAADLRRRIDLDRALVDLTSRVRQNPADNIARGTLTRKIDEAVRQPVVSPETMINIGRAQEALGNNTLAREYKERARRITPDRGATPD